MDRNLGNNKVKVKPTCEAKGRNLSKDNGPRPWQTIIIKIMPR